MQNFLTYSDWQQTADTLHMYVQIVGKVKLERCSERPEWAHVRLYLTSNGLSTGLIPGTRNFFQINFNFHQSFVEIITTDHQRIEIPLVDGVPVSRFYKDIMKGLDEIDATTQINLKPQEFYNPIMFDVDDIHKTYHVEEVLTWFNNLVFSYGCMLKFLSPFRGKVLMPGFFWGSFDLACIVFSGKPVPFEKDTKISKYAFDEEFLEVGFWPGDVNNDMPSFYSLPYPFVTDLKNKEEMLKPDKAIWAKEVKEFFFSLKDAYTYREPEKAVLNFFNSSVDIIQNVQPWERFKDISAPLQYS